MCLLTLANSPQIAKKDIKVYKLVLINYGQPNKVNAWSRPFEYNKHVLYQQELLSTKKPDSFYDKKAGAEFGLNGESAYEITVISLNINFISNGFHSASSRERFPLIGKHPKVGRLEAIKEFKIPAGSQYYKDGTGLLVSNQIIYIGD